MSEMVPGRAHVVRRRDSSTAAGLDWIDQALGPSKRRVDADEMSALLSRLGWEVTFPQGAGSASVHVASTDRLLLIRYRGAPFVARYRRLAAEIPDGPRIAVIELVHGGRGRFVRDGTEHDVVAGDAILHPPVGEHVTEWLDDDCTRTYVVMTTRLFGRRSDALLDGDAFLQRDAPLLPAAASLVDVLIDEPDTLVATAAGQTLYGLLSATVAAAIARPERSDDGALRERARAVLAERFAEPGLDADEVARALRVSRRHLFAQFSGSSATFASTLRDIRLDRAAELLASGDPALTVRRVARESGFGGPTQLARAFRDRFGITPSQFRSAAMRGPMPEGL